MTLFVKPQLSLSKRLPFPLPNYQMIERFNFKKLTDRNNFPCYQYILP